LHVGNFLNAGNRRLGQAAGFDLETLSKLNDTKTTDNKSTILEVIVEMIKDQTPELLKFDKSELELIDEGARVSLQTLEADLKNLRKNFDSTAQIAPTISPVTDDKFPQRYKDFEEKAKVDLETMEKDFSDANAKYEAVVLAFGEDPKKMGPEEFFLVWKTFCGRIAEISDKIDVERDKAEKLRQREKKKEEAAKAPARGGGAPRGGRAGPGGRAGEESTGGEAGGEPGGEESAGGEGGGVARGGGGARRGGPGARGRGRGGRAGNVEDQDVVNSLFAKMQAGNVYKDRRNQ